HEGNGRRRGLPVAQERTRGRRQHGCGTHRKRVGAVRWRAAAPARGSRWRALHRRSAGAPHGPQLRFPLVVATSPIGDGASAPRPSTAPLVVAFAVAAAVFVARSRNVRVPDPSESAPNASARYVDLSDIRPENVSRL